MTINSVLGWMDGHEGTSDGKKRAKINEMITAINAGGGAATLDDLTDVVITGPADNDLLQYDLSSGRWVDRSLSEALVEPAFSKNTAFNKNFGTGTTNIVEIGSVLGTSQVAMTDSNGKLVTEAEQTGHNLVLGSGSGQVAEGDHEHAIDDLSDVVEGTPNDDDVLTYDTGTSKWISQAPTGGGASVAYVEALNMIGSANAQPIAATYEVCSKSTFGVKNDLIYFMNVGAGGNNLTFNLPLPLNIGTKKLHISNIAFRINVANDTNYLDYVRIHGQDHESTNVIEWGDGTDRKAGVNVSVSVSLTSGDMGAYTRCKIVFYTINATSTYLKITNPILTCYYE